MTPTCSSHHGGVACWAHCEGVGGNGRVCVLCKTAASHFRKKWGEGWGRGLGGLHDTYLWQPSGQSSLAAAVLRSPRSVVRASIPKLRRFQQHEACRR